MQRSKNISTGKATILAAIITGAFAILGICITKCTTAQPPAINSSSEKPKDSLPKLIVSGTVIDGETTLPMSRATVKIVGRIESTTTDDAGGFRLELLHDLPSSIRLSVNVNGYMPHEELRDFPPFTGLDVRINKKQ